MNENNPGTVDERLGKAIGRLSITQKEDLLRFINSMPFEKRECRRKKHSAEVTYADTERATRGYIQNISASGLYIEPNGPFAEGQILTFTFDHPSKDYHLKISGMVARRNERGFGVQFSEPVDDI